MGAIKTDHRGKVIGYPPSRKGYGKRAAARYTRRTGKAAARDTRDN